MSLQIYTTVHIRNLNSQRGAFPEDSFKLKYCICTCAVCIKHQPNILSPVKVTRNKKEIHINWINCNSCKNWVHLQYSGLTKKRKYKTWKTYKGKENRLLFQMHQVVFWVLQREIISSLLSNIELDFTKTLYH